MLAAPVTEARPETMTTGHTLVLRAQQANWQNHAVKSSSRWGSLQSPVLGATYVSGSTHNTFTSRPLISWVQADNLAELRGWPRSADRPAWPRDHRCTIIQTGSVAAGRSVFTAVEAENELGVGHRSFLDAAERLQRSRKLLTPRQGFYVVVPPQYAGWGAPPPTWFIDCCFLRSSPTGFALYF